MIPLKMNPGFFIVAALIGFLNSFTLVGTISWVGIIFVSVLVHEYGHALTAKLFGQKPRIELVAFGGVTIPEGPKLKPWKEFLVVLMGPMFGFFLFVVTTLLLQLPIVNSYARWLLLVTRNVNLFWTAINLLPILPLDGGQLVRVVLEKFFKSKAWQISLYISLIISALFSIAFFLIGLFLVGVIFIIFCFQSIETLRRMKDFTDADQQDDNRMLLFDVEESLKKGDQERAIPKLQSLIDQTKSGLIHAVASEYLAKILYDKEKFQEVYHLLAPIERQLSTEAKVILYFASYEIEDYQRVVTLSGVCFQENRTFDVAIRAAAANAIQGHIKESLEWLKTARSFNETELRGALRDQAFDTIRQDERFQTFLKESAS